MNKVSSVLVMAASVCTCAFSISTNIPGTGTETVMLSDLQFSGGAGEVAATISNLAVLESIQTTYEGGVGVSSGLAASGIGCACSPL